MQPNLTIVSAFFDIGRSNWTNGPAYLKRTTDEYFGNFERLLKLQNNIVVFTSTDLVHRFDHYHHIKKNLKVVGLEDWRRDIWPEFFEPIKKIHHNELISGVNQPWNPEYWSVDYVMVNMLKAYFVNYAIEFGFVTDEMVAWIDFGYARKNDDVPTDIWNYRFDRNKIHMFTIKPNCPSHMNLIPIIQQNDVWITGCHIIASKENWCNLLEMVYQNLKLLVDNNLIDDDQTVLYMAYCEHPEVFEIHKIDPNDWFCIFRKFNNSVPVNTGEFVGVD